MREVKAGFLKVCFIDFWLADQFNSLAVGTALQVLKHIWSLVCRDTMLSYLKVFLDIEFFFCFFISTTVRLWRDHDTDLIENPQNLPLQQNINDVLNNSTDFTYNFQCGSYSYGLRYFIAIIPAYIRFAQCIRRYLGQGTSHSNKSDDARSSKKSFWITGSSTQERL